MQRSTEAGAAAQEPWASRVAAQEDGRRLDVCLARRYPQHSRRRIQDWIRAGCVLVEGEPCRPRDAVRTGDLIEVWPQEPAPAQAQAQDLPLAVVHADADLIVLDKAAGQVMHTAPGHADGTVQNALLHHFPATARLPRAGIVHRLDRGTAGLVAVGHTEAACAALVRQLQERTLGRRYRALVRGELVAGGTVDAPIGRDPRNRQRMRVRAGGREAVTHYRVARRFRGCTLLDIRLETGRTHQIRVHMAHCRHPVVGDPVYGARARMAAGLSTGARAQVETFPRQALHACALHLRHPTGGRELRFASDLPEDFRALLASLDAL